MRIEISGFGRIHLETMELKNIEIKVTKWLTLKDRAKQRVSDLENRTKDTVQNEVQRNKKSNQRFDFWKPYQWFPSLSAYWNHLGSSIDAYVHVPLLAIMI